MSREPETINLHASAVALDGRGALILGASGSGKSGLALRLMALGAGIPPAADLPPGASGHGPGEMAALTLAYGLAGFGYIITAPFLPVIASDALPG